MPSSRARSTRTSVAALILSILGAAAGQASPPAGSGDTARIASAWRRVPLSFEENLGQTDAQARFLARGADGTVFLGPGGATLRLPGSAAAVVLVGANPSPTLRGERPLPGRVNHYAGHDPSAWKTGIPTWAEVRVESVYPGIDQVFHGRNGALEFDFVVSPGRDPETIRLRVAGADGLALDSAGNLRARVGTDEIVQHAPVSWQGEGTERRPVASRFVLCGGGEVGIALGSYDRAEVLVIDPTLSYSTYLGTSGNEYVNGVVVDAAGNAWLEGQTDSAAFPTTLGVLDTTYNGSTDAFVTKLDPTGSNVLLSTYLGGTGEDIADWFGARAIRLDAGGNVVLVGRTKSSDFPVTANALQGTYGGGFDAFVAVLSADLGTLRYATYFGGSGAEEPAGLDLDASGAALICGYTSSGNLATPDAYQPTLRGAADTFLARMTLPAPGAPAALLYSSYLGGANGGNEIAIGIAADADGTLVVAGWTNASDFPTTAGAFDRSYNGIQDAFVARFDPTLSGAASLVASTFLGGSGQDVARSVAIGGSGRPYVAGIANTGFPTTTSAYQRTFVKPRPNNPNGSDGFITVLNPGLNSLVYSTYLGGTGGTGGSDTLRGIAVDSAGIAWATGQSSSTNYPTTANAVSRVNAGAEDVAVSAIDPALSGVASLVYSTYLGGPGNDFGFALTLDSSGSVYVCGGSKAAGFPTTASAYQGTWQGGNDGIVFKLARP